MSLPDVKTMDFGFDGQPFVPVRANSADTSDFGFDGQPFFPAGGGGSPPAVVRKPVLLVISM